MNKLYLYQEVKFASVDIRLKKTRQGKVKPTTACKKKVVIIKLNEQLKSNKKGDDLFFSHGRCPQFFFKLVILV